ncbi:alpha/beta hydrolase [Halobellus clavatus]|uniref:Acetyl esterase n=1 Tax=Halobellus clavatus TaxID=660517 RepID=A0A1H3GJD6_9EURY|nr:alpha/beta hydrolase [Halobellus clavatus]SDY03472.1 acetyl esterase [Halobellus clavatus]
MRETRAAEPASEVQALLDARSAADAPPLHEIPISEARAMHQEMLTVAEPTIDLAAVEDRTIAGPDGEIDVRIYDPGGERPRSTILFFHGGGWVLGDIESYDETCRKVAEATDDVVVSVGYRLAPEHPFPAGLKDCYAALEWAHAAATDLGGDADRIVLAGDSAGGNLATATALLARDRDGPMPAYQVLIYPPTGEWAETESAETNDGYFIERTEMEWFDACYYADEADRGNVYARPRRAADLSGLPPATVVTAGFDPLRDDSVRYAERLADAGVPVTHHHYDEMTHGFFSHVSEPVALETAQEAHEAIATDLEAAFA